MTRRIRLSQTGLLDQFTDCFLSLAQRHQQLEARGFAKRFESLGKQLEHSVRHRTRVRHDDPLPVLCVKVVAFMTRGVEQLIIQTVQFPCRTAEGLRI